MEADITYRAQAEAAVQQAAGRFGRLDTLVNNAGLMLLGPVAGADAGGWDRMIAINVKGLLYTTRAALPHLLQAAEHGPRRGSPIRRPSRPGSSGPVCDSWAPVCCEPGRPPLWTPVNLLGSRGHLVQRGRALAVPFLPGARLHRRGPGGGVAQRETTSGWAHAVAFRDAMPFGVPAGVASWVV